jgi:hypothetical protein
VASAFHKLPPFKSETLLGLTLNGSCSGFLATRDFLYSNNTLNRGDNAQPFGAEKYGRYVLAPPVARCTNGSRFQISV